MPFITIFTPTFNRAESLIQTYMSLRKQSNNDFIWLVIDDGSTDNTREVVQDIQEKENNFQIQYIYKQNGGMHTAHNVAYSNISTELNMCIDSDDILAENAIEVIWNHWNNVKHIPDVCGMIGIDVDLKGNIIGKGFPEGLEKTTLGGYYAEGGRGDKKLIYRTEIIKRYPEYPVFEGEKYVALAYKYRLIDQDYYLSVLNHPLCIVDYRNDGSTNNMYKQYLRNPKGFMFWRKICMQYPTTKKRKIVDCIHYIAEGKIAKEKGIIVNSPHRLLTTICYPFGLLLYEYILYIAS